MEFDDEDAVDKIVLLGLHVIKGVRLAAKKGLKKEEQIQGGGCWDQSYHGQGAGPSRGRPQSYSSGGGRYGGGGAPYYGAGSSSGGYSGYGGQGQGGYSGFSDYSSLGQTWSSGQGGAAQGGGAGGGGPLRRHQRYTRGANRYDPYARK